MAICITLVNTFIFGRPPGRREIDLFTEGGPKQRDFKEGVDCLKQHKCRPPQASTDLTSLCCTIWCSTCSCDSSCSQAQGWLCPGWAIFELRLSAGLVGRELDAEEQCWSQLHPHRGHGHAPCDLPRITPRKLCKEKS